MTGNTDHNIRIYQLLPGPPERIAELSSHLVLHFRRFSMNFIESSTYFKAALIHVYFTKNSVNEHFLQIFLQDHVDSIQFSHSSERYVGDLSILYTHIYPLRSSTRYP